MKKRTAILFFGFLLLALGSYVAWCWRCFYLPPRLVFEDVVSPEGRSVAEAWKKTESYPPPLAFNARTAWRNLCRPWRCEMPDSTYVLGAPDCGLWATNRGQLWGFSKVGGKWDPSTVEMRVDEVGPKLFHWATIASRVEALGASGATIEVISLGPPTEIWPSPFNAELELIPDSPGLFHGHAIVGRARVEGDQERRDLLEAFARSVRGGMSLFPSGGCGLGTESLPGGETLAPHGLVVARDDQRLEFLISFDRHGGFAFGEGVDDPVGNFDSRAGACYFDASPYAKAVFDRFLDEQKIERMKPAQ